MWPAAPILVALSALAVPCLAARGDPVFFFTLFPTSKREYRDELIYRMDNISKWSCTNEPGVQKYALVIPREDDNVTAWSIEQYDSDDVFDSHLAAPTVANGLFAWSRSIPNLWSRSPAVTNFTVLPDMSFVRSDFGRVADPYLSVETITYKADAVSQALPFWRDALAAARNETGTLAFGVYLDPTNKNLIHTLTAYESADYKENVHLKGAAAMALEANTKDLRVSITGHLLQKKGGFLYKGTPCA